MGIYGGGLANLKITQIKFKSANKIKMEAINVNTLKISNNGIIMFKSSRFNDYFSILLQCFNCFFKNYLTVVPDCTASWPLLDDIGLKIPQHFRLFL